MAAYRMNNDHIEYDILADYQELLGQKYQDLYEGAEVLRDIEIFEQLKQHLESPLLIRVRALKQSDPAIESISAPKSTLWSIKLYQMNAEVMLSNILPSLENLGFSVIRENSVEIMDASKKIWYLRSRLARKADWRNQA